MTRLEPNTEKRFYLQYAFPPSSVGETGRTGAPGRREVGHGALAEKALRYALPDAKTFPYSMRVESLITESCGSSSMASVCGGCLALLDAGVPLTTSVAGVAMGVLLDDVDDPVVLKSNLRACSTPAFHTGAWRRRRLHRYGRLGIHAAFLAADGSRRRCLPTPSSSYHEDGVDVGHGL